MQCFSNAGEKWLAGISGDYPNFSPIPPLQFDHTNYSISYMPGESDSNIFGGNSNWCGPVWIPLNYLLIQTLHHRYSFYGNSIQLPFPTGSSALYNLRQIADALSEKIITVFLQDDSGGRPVHGNAPCVIIT